MADMETREDQKISECLQSAFGYSDEQLLKQLDQANEKFKNVTFDGAEDRLMKRFMARKAELEKETAAAKPETSTQNESAETEEKAELGENKKKEKKVIRFNRKKKFLATAALVAAIGGMLGGTAIGKRNHFFKKSEGVEGILLNNSNNKVDFSDVEKIYEEIEEKLNIPALKLGYIPEKMQYEDSIIYEESAQIRFLYQDKVVYFIQKKREVDTSARINADRAISKSVFNRWINQKINYYVNDLEEEQECEAVIVVNDNYYYIFGYIPETEFREIVEYLYFY